MRLKLAVFGIVVALIALQSLSRELDPLEGRWVPATGTLNGERIVPQPIWGLWLTVSPRGYVTVETVWTCGVRRALYAEGVMVDSESRIELFRENWATSEREPFANGVLDKLPYGRLGFRFSDEEGEFYIEFEREENASTVLDLVGWH